MMKSESPAYARLYNENRVKDEILQSLTRAYREICCYCVQHPDAEIADDPSTNLAASCIEAFFLHRIKGRGARRIASFITGSDQSPLPTSSPDCDVNYWQFIRAYIPQKLQLQLVQRLQHQRSEIGCCRAWVRACLNEGTTSSYLASVLQDRDRICRYYYANSIILDTERRAVFLELVKSLDEAEFQLNLRSSLLNYWSSSAAPQLLLPPEQSGQAEARSADQRSFVHPGFNALLQRRNRSVSMPTATATAADQSTGGVTEADAAFQRAEASILSGAVADIRRQLDEIRRQQAVAGGRPQQLLGRSVRRRQQRQLPRYDEAFAEDDEAEAAAATRAIIGDSLGARVRCETSWSAPPSGFADFSDTVEETDAQQRTLESVDEAADKVGSDEAGTAAGAPSEAAEAAASSNEQQSQLTRHLPNQHTSWAGVWSSSVDAGAAANAAAADVFVEGERAGDTAGSSLARQHSASAPDFELSKTIETEGIAQSVSLVDDQSAGVTDDVVERGASRCGSINSSGGPNLRRGDSAEQTGTSGSAKDSDAQSDSFDWVMLGDELLIKNDETYQDLLDLFPGVSQPAFVSSISCPVCLCRLDCSFGLGQSQQQQPPPQDQSNPQAQQQQQQQQQVSVIRSPVTDRYDGRLYCPDCCPLKSPCPRDILDNWDFTPYPVSVRSFTVLELIWHHPMIDLSKASPHLYSLQPQLAEVLNLRRQALVLWRYLSACQSNREISDQFRTNLAGLDYMYESRLTLHLYSAADLCAVRVGELRTRLGNSVLLARGHVTNCGNCRTITARCWICRREDRPILLHELDQYVECVSLNCASVRHADCGGGGGAARCPRCDTLQRLAIDSLRFDLPDD